MYTIHCDVCGGNCILDATKMACICGGKISFEYDYRNFNVAEGVSSMWRYRNLLPVSNADNIVTLYEGMTPLVPSSITVRSKVYLKDETRNPTGSMKDRALSVAMTKVKEFGKTHSVIASTGNAGVSASAYAARAGVSNTILVPCDTATERLVAMSVLGSEIYGVDATIEQLKDMVNALTAKLGWVNVSTFRKANPYQAEAPKTIAFEIFEQLSRVPDFVLVPVGGAGTLGGIYRGFLDLLKIGWTDRVPKLVAVHHEHYNSLEIALAKTLHTDEDLLQLSTSMDGSLPCIARNIQHTYCFDGEEALGAIRKTGGRAISVSDEEIVQAQGELARRDGIFAEPSSASITAAIKKLENDIYFSHGSVVVGVISGSGFRETSSIRLKDSLMRVVDPNHIIEEITVAH